MADWKFDPTPEWPEASRVWPDMRGNDDTRATDDAAMRPMEGAPPASEFAEAEPTGEMPTDEMPTGGAPTEAEPSTLEGVGVEGVGPERAEAALPTDTGEATAASSGDAETPATSPGDAEVPSLTTVESRRAIEALRSGVPNRDAVRALGSGQLHIETRVRALLDRAADDVVAGAPTPGLLVAGDFGTGKSHLLEYLQDIALAENFVCSKIVVSKETPLHDPARLFRAAVQSARVPKRRGAALTEIAFSLAFDTRAYADFVTWANGPEARLNSRFPASLFLWERTREEEIHDRIISFWAGDPLEVRELRGWLRDQGEAATYKLESVAKRDLPMQHFAFLAHLIAAAGYSGWVLLVDELELIGQYAFKSRAKSYAELARWAGKVKGEGLPGVVTVFAITHDFSRRVLEERNDLERIPGKLRASGNDADERLARAAEAGMRLIARESHLLRPPTRATIDRAYERIRAIHGAGYRWEPPALSPGEQTTSTSMRQYVRRWINEWDLQRLYPTYQPQTAFETLDVDYHEDPDLERADPLP
ncbi:MAG: DUF2791 family P-loop domain-containing protein [Chloroflexi bacterium]|nr:DUF2791 family P-loop domain-containing protein [Chloroflexota bacterium]